MTPTPFLIYGEQGPFNSSVSPSSHHHSLCSAPKFIPFTEGLRSGLPTNHQSPITSHGFLPATLLPPMAQRFCEVALPVPLRSPFPYAVPASLRDEALIGRRVVVPFRNRALVGIALAESDRAPPLAGGKKAIKEIAELMDSVPALPSKLLELAQWISRYYLAPIGETLRAMLPPEIEVRHDREYSLTDDGRAYLKCLLSAEETTDEEAAEREFLH